MNIVQAVKRCAIDAVEATVPCDVVLGKVESVEPLSVIAGQLVLSGEVVMLAEHLKSRKEKIEFSVYEREIVINEGISEGDVLILIRKSGGEAYVAVGKI